MLFNKLPVFFLKNVSWITCLECPSLALLCINVQRFTIQKHGYYLEGITYSVIFLRKQTISYKLLNNFVSVSEIEHE